MPDRIDPLVLDFVEWVAREPRRYAEVVETWRTSCPRLTIWEDAADRGFVRRETLAESGLMLTVTEAGAAALREHGRLYLAGSASRGRMISTMRSAEVPGGKKPR